MINCSSILAELLISIWVSTFKVTCLSLQKMRSVKLLRVRWPAYLACYEQVLREVTSGCKETPDGQESPAQDKPFSHLCENQLTDVSLGSCPEEMFSEFIGEYNSLLRFLSTSLITAMRKEANNFWDHYPFSLWPANKYLDTTQAT